MTNKIYTLASGKTAKAVTTRSYGLEDITTANPVFALFDKTGDEIDPLDKYGEVIEQWFDYDDALDLALQTIADYTKDFFGSDLDSVEIDEEKDGTKIIRIVFDINDIGFKSAANLLDDIHDDFGKGHDTAFNLFHSSNEIVFEYDNKHDLTSGCDNVFTFYLDVIVDLDDRYYDFNGEDDKLKIEFDFAY